MWLVFSRYVFFLCFLVSTRISQMVRSVQSSSIQYNTIQYKYCYFQSPSTVAVSAARRAALVPTQNRRNRERPAGGRHPSRRSLSPVGERKVHSLIPGPSRLSEDMLQRKTSGLPNEPDLVSSRRGRRPVLYYLAGRYVVRSPPSPPRTACPAPPGSDRRGLLSLTASVPAGSCVSIGV